MEQKTYGVWAVRGSGSVFGAAQAWCKEDGKPLEFDSEDAAKAYAAELNGKATANVRYYVKEKEPEPGAIRKTETAARRKPRKNTQKESEKKNKEGAALEGEMAKTQKNGKGTE